MKVLVTGGAGYIGSHTVLQLLEAGRDVVVVDNLCNSSADALWRVSELSGKEICFVNGDVRDAKCLKQVFDEHDIDSVIHFAGLKAVGESVGKPLEYYDNNVNGTLVLLDAMRDADVDKIVFSSSATVYGAISQPPYNESMPTGGTTNPYGTSKHMVEQVLRDYAVAFPKASVALLRYFNPIGAHPSGQIGEDPTGIPNNLMPFIAQVAVGKREQLSVFGGDYPTEDGTCRRDYLHVVDLADGHVAALKWLDVNSGAKAFNLGTGNPLSVLEMIRSFERVTGVNVPYEIVDRRAGDLPEFWADASLAERELGWKAELDVDAMMRDTWRWQSQNPDGYGS
jgi:UDP-glucose 4-epimerase